uniref:Liver carboxylesterase 1-like n=1 Tax=Hirondellea gigas TaxID=1518452 RepID=A0A6A7G1B5_9CRUS
MKAPTKWLSVQIAVVLATTLISATPAENHEHAKYFKMIDPVRHRYHLAGLLNEGSSAVETVMLQDEGQREVTGSDGPRVTVDGLGIAQGRILHTPFGKPFSAFHSIPYAHKPDRFQYPVIFDDTYWTGSMDEPYDATYFRGRCPQSSLISDVVSGDEDCLQVSVYSPIMNFTEGPPAELLPVMVFIHGGSYMTGEAMFYMPSKLLDREVVVVVLQYRLGTLGFLYSGTIDAPGNMGLMDQITALRWVQKYISNFGGDPGLVTLFGQSAGGASTSLLQISDLIRGENKNNDGEDLVHQFIPMSGSALEYWTIDNNIREDFITQVESTGCDTNGMEKDMVDCMKALTLDEVVIASLKVFMHDRMTGGLGFLGQCPVVQDALLDDPDAEDLELVIIEQPLKSLRAGHFLQVPTMAGAVRDEGLMVVGVIYDYILEKNGLENNTFFMQFEALPLLAKAFGIHDPTNAVANSFRLAYMPENEVIDNWDIMSGPLVDLSGVLFVKSGTWTLAHRMHMQNNSVPVFIYSFEFESDDSIFDWIFIDNPDMPIHSGVCHADDLLYLFNMPSYQNDRELEMARRMSTLYYNFARYGNPTPEEVADEPGQWQEFTKEWIPYSADGQEFMLLQDDFTMQKDFTTRWNYNKYEGIKNDSSSDKSIRARSDVNSRNAEQETTNGGGVSQQTFILGLFLTVVAVLFIVGMATVIIIRAGKKTRRIQDDDLDIMMISKH